jgi:hypothetical protein
MRPGAASKKAINNTTVNIFRRCFIFAAAASFFCFPKKTSAIASIAAADA